MMICPACNGKRGALTFGWFMTCRYCDGVGIISCCGDEIAQPDGNREHWDGTCFTPLRPQRNGDR